MDASASTIGLLFSCGGAGGIAGALLARSISSKLGEARTIWLPVSILWPLGLVIPLSSSGAGLAWFGAGFFFVSLGSVVYNIAQVSFRQAICPHELLGRMNATMRFLVWGTLPLGGLLGGGCGSLFGNRAALWIAVGGQLLAPLWVITSPLRASRELPASEVEESPLVPSA
jgi:MFS transporter